MEQAHKEQENLVPTDQFHRPGASVRQPEADVPESLMKSFRV